MPRILVYINNMRREQFKELDFWVRYVAGNALHRFFSGYIAGNVLHLCRMEVRPDWILGTFKEGAPHPLCAEGLSHGIFLPITNPFCTYCEPISFPVIGHTWRDTEILIQLIEKLSTVKTQDIEVLNNREELNVRRTEIRRNDRTFYYNQCVLLTCFFQELNIRRTKRW